MVSCPLNNTVETMLIEERLPVSREAEEPPRTQREDGTIDPRILSVNVVIDLAGFLAPPHRKRVASANRTSVGPSNRVTFFGAGSAMVFVLASVSACIGWTAPHRFLAQVVDASLVRNAADQQAEPIPPTFGRRHPVQGDAALEMVHITRLEIRMADTRPAAAENLPDTIVALFMQRSGIGHEFERSTGFSLLRADRHREVAVAEVPGDCIARPLCVDIRATDNDPDRCGTVPLQDNRKRKRSDHHS